MEKSGFILVLVTHPIDRIGYGGQSCEGRRDQKGKVARRENAADPAMPPHKNPEMMSKHSRNRRVSTGRPQSACPRKIPRSVNIPETCVVRMTAPLSIQVNCLF
jgi:hypothetical protein